MTDILTIRIEPAEQARDNIAERLGAIDRGEDVEDRTVLILTSESDLARVFSEKNIELIRTIGTHQPESMRETARLTERAIADVSRNLNELETLGLVKFIQEGRAKRPVVWYDEITVEFPVSTTETNSVVV